MKNNKLLNTKVKSSTLIEVIVSMVIISLLSAFFFTFLGSLKRDHNIELKIKASQHIDNMSRKAFSTKKAEPCEVQIQNIRIISTIDTSSFKHIQCINYRALTLSNKHLASKKIYLIEIPKVE